MHQWEVAESDLAEYAKVRSPHERRLPVLIDTDGIYIPNRIRSANLHHEIVHPSSLPPGLRAGRQEQDISVHPFSHME